MTGRRLPVGSARYDEVADWLYREAELLDDGDEHTWLVEMVSRRVVYRLPLRQTVRRADGAGFATDGYHLDERYGSLLARVERNGSPSAWTEDPPARTRRLVGNIRVVEHACCLNVRSNLLVYRTRDGQTQPTLLAGERRDVLDREDGVLRLAERLILLDHSALQVPNLAYFF